MPLHDSQLCADAPAIMRGDSWSEGSAGWGFIWGRNVEEERKLLHVELMCI